jgi:hypothetical protein
MGKNALQIIEDVTRNTIFQLFTISQRTHPRQQSAGYGSIVHLDVSAEKSVLEFE